MKILMIDDSSAVTDEIRKNLPDFNLNVALNLEEFDEKLSSAKYDCLVIDISGLADNSLEIIRNLKRKNIRSGLIITSERDCLTERIEALSTGADDFLTKPYHVSELTARIVSLGRRMSVSGQEQLVYNEIKVGKDKKMVYVNGEEVSLTKKELDLLMYFIEHKNSVVKKESLISCLTGQLQGARNNADVMYAHVKNLKRKLAEAGCRNYLKAIYGIGYKWEEY